MKPMEQVFAEIEEYKLISVDGSVGKFLKRRGKSYLVIPTIINNPTDEGFSISCAVYNILNWNELVHAPEVPIMDFIKNYGDLHSLFCDTLTSIRNKGDMFIATKALLGQEYDIVLDYIDTYAKFTDSEEFKPKPF